MPMNNDQSGGTAPETAPGTQCAGQAKQADIALQAHRNAHGRPDHDTKVSISLLLSDLMHLADREGIDFAACADDAFDDYMTECFFARGLPFTSAAKARRQA